MFNYLYKYLNNLKSYCFNKKSVDNGNHLYYKIFDFVMKVEYVLPFPEIQNHAYI